MGPRAAIPESLGSKLAGGVFFRCDESGSRLISGAEALASCLGVASGALEGGLGPVLGAGAPGLYAEAFSTASEEPASVLLPYPHPAGGRRWLSLRLSPPCDGTEGLLAFLRDETTLQESLLKVAAAQSADVENSARLQAAVLLEGQALAVRGLDYQTATIPSKQVDGDFLDVARLSRDSVDFLLGDVMGKGMDAAIVGAMIKMGFARSLCSSLFGALALPDPAEICRGVDSLVGARLLKRGCFATLTYARLESRLRALSFVDCGHTSFIHYSASTGECWMVKGANMPLGFSEGQSYRSFLLPIDPGDLILLYTDGLSECCNRWGESFGEERVAYLLRTNSGLSARDIASAILRAGFSYSASGFNDDVSIVCLRPFSGEPAGGLETRLSVTLSARDLSGLREAEDCLEADLGEWIPGAGAETRAGLLLAFHEAMTNVAEHGLGGRDGRCDLRWRYLDELLSLELSYTGPDYDWSGRPASPIRRLAASGYGRLVMHEVMDSVILCKGLRGRKRLAMCRRLGVASEGRPGAPAWVDRPAAVPEAAV